MTQDTPDLIKDRETTTNLHRVLTNALVLLDVGLFPGKHSVGISEVRECLAALQGQSLAKLSELAPKPPAA